MPEKLASVRLRVGRTIKELRSLRGWSQAALAERAGKAEKHVGQVERGEVNVTIDVLAAVADALDVDVAQLFNAQSTGSDGATVAITPQEFAQIEAIVERVKRTRVLRSRSN